MGTFWGHTNAKRAHSDPTRPGQNGLFELKSGGTNLLKDRTFRLRFHFALDRRADRGVKKAQPVRTFRNPISLALHWQALAAKRGWSQADLARHLKVSEARISQVFALLKLTPEVKEMLMELGDYLSWVPIPERELRALAKVNPHEQLEKARAVIRLTP